MKRLFFILTAAVLLSCNTTSTNEDSEEAAINTIADSSTEDFSANNVAGSTIGDSHLVEQWLISTIENYFHPQDGEPMQLSYFCTDDYVELKQDAMNVNIPGELTEEQFREKWKHKNLDLVGIQSGFMISAQDYHTIKVTESALKEKIDEDTWVFAMIVEDIVYKGKYWREVVVSKAGNSYIVEDVKEIREVLPE